MPSRDKDQFVDAVKPALESLLSDLQRTTEVLRRHHTKPGDRDLETSSHTAYKGQRFDTDLEPIYQEQNVTKTSREHDAASRGSSRHDLRSSSAQRDHSQLDSMLVSMAADMAAHGVHTIPKGDCASCGKSIIGQVVIALGKMWHPEHFNCCQCGEEIGHRNFFERGGKAYCENDYHDLFSPRCAYCNGPIKDASRCVSALGKTFHAEHFVCHECGRPFGDEGFHEKDGVAYCRDDFFARYAPKCKGCDKPIRSKFITALGTHWHPECFTCQECGSRFDGGSFFDHNGHPLCETHYHEKRGSLCHHCKKPISGRCVSAMGHKFHPDHFCCVYCNRQLCRGTFKEANGRPFCHKCYNKINNA
ncbi:LIM domain containing protein [Aphelenchoides avenae]|nr:LIM domain containing protein [Aphelenchus avenae]